MKPVLLRVPNDKVSAHAAEKENNIDRKTLGMYAGKFHQDEHSAMKPNYVTTSVLRSSVTKGRTRRHKKKRTAVSKSGRRNL